MNETKLKLDIRSIKAMSLIIDHPVFEALVDKYHDGELETIDGTKNMFGYNPLSDAIYLNAEFDGVGMFVYRYQVYKSIPVRFIVSCPSTGSEYFSQEELQEAYDDRRKESPMQSGMNEEEADDTLEHYKRALDVFKFVRSIMLGERR